MSNPVLAQHILPSSNLWLNRRASVRHQSSRSVSGRLTAGKTEHPAAIVNISLGGVALRLDKRLRKGTRVLVRLDNPTLDISYDLAARVAHAFQRPDGKWIVGFQFARTLTSQELAHLL